MNRKISDNEFRDSLDRRLSPLQPDPWMAQKIRNRARQKEGEPVKKRLSVGTVLVLVILLLSVSVGIATVSGWDVMQFLYGNRTAQRIPEVEVFPVHREATAGGALFRVESAIYDGKKLVFDLYMENLALKRQLGQESTPFQGETSTVGDFRYIPATVVKMSSNTQHNYIIVNKGYEDGVLPQSGIITAEGVIGIIDMVEKNYSYGITFLNDAMSVSARIGADGAIGPLTWDGVRPDGALLSEIPLQNLYSPGDTVWTSGYSALFPAGIPLGTLGTSRVVNGAMNQIRVQLFENLSSVRYVTIVENLGRDEILSLESMEGSEL